MVWHCQRHEREFATQEDYLQHLEQDHPDAGPEQRSSELLSAAMGPSLVVNRECPLCPTAFTDMPEMQRHLRHHLERLALFSLPAGDDGDDRDAGTSADSHQVIQGRGRRDSIEQDFDDDVSEDGHSALPGDVDAHEPVSLETIQQQSLPKLIGGIPEDSRPAHLIHQWIEVLEPGDEDMEDGVANPNDAPAAASTTTAVKPALNVGSKLLFCYYPRCSHQHKTSPSKSDVKL